MNVHLAGPPLAFEAANLRKEYRLEGHAIPVLTGVDLSIPCGEWTVLVGASGSGKTTLLHLLGALDEPTEGTVSCRGTRYGVERVAARPAWEWLWMRPVWTRMLSKARDSKTKARLRRESIGFVFQAYHLLPELSALENVMLPGLHWGSDKKALRARARTLLDSFGLSDRSRHRPQELSGGEQQRVAMARALVNDPDIILADEPTGNLDARTGEEIVGILRELHQSGKTIVMVTHDPSLARAADRVLALEAGRVVPFSADGPKPAPSLTP